MGLATAGVPGWLVDSSLVSVKLITAGDSGAVDASGCATGSASGTVDASGCATGLACSTAIPSEGTAGFAFGCAF